MGQIKKLQQLCHKNAILKGFYDGYNQKAQLHNSTLFRDRHPLELLCLIHSEISEAMEALRGSEKDNNLGEELADTVIRILDAAEYWGINLEDEILKKMEKNKKRSFKHGKNF